MTLSVSLSHAFAGFRLEAAFAAPPGVTALFGRSGSGKTTVVNAVAGLLRPDRADRRRRHGAARHRAGASTCRRTAAGSAMCSRMRGCSRI
jgi:ABC-type glutathione transport system ATPase component